ncbi:NUDIX domain-containing protein [Cytobacillus oceanisediminis]|uniref:NUDIX hydrolase n=1 Tax=Cytobacillus oceanisediminis TaxID=665099 RepID=UPI0023DCAEAB|nr:NUDIX domain-containing protein [Cytobacillus oceanisediminis]MDF2036148.1 NUDIX domain-containing protein [Cytobacillus oceanisediminis]
MNNVFGNQIKELDYKIRKGAYAVIFNSENEKVLTVQTQSGHYFLPGGGIEKGESEIECLKREVLEETGYEISNFFFIGNAKSYLPQTKKRPMLSDGYFYLAGLADKIQEPTEEDHVMKWIEIRRLAEVLVHEHHIWAVQEGIRYKTQRGGDE